MTRPPTPETQVLPDTALSPPVAPALVTRVLALTLDPIVDEACAQTDPEAALLRLKICDPACGTGTFLRAVAQRMGRRLARVRSGRRTPSPKVMRQALYDVICHCLYGVDVDETSVDVCRQRLALHAPAPDAALSCLDHHIQCGDSLLGATPALLAQGIPDAAFTPVAGDDKTVAAALRKRNQRERLGQMALPFPTAQTAPGPVATPARLCADAWCAAFLWPKTREALPAITHDTWRWLHLASERVAAATQTTITRLASQYRILHWHIAFPEVFTIPDVSEPPENVRAGWHGGFDVVLGKPPWQPLTTRTQMKRAIPLLRYRLQQDNNAVRTLQSPVLFLETARQLIRPTGRISCLIPAQLVTTETAFFQTLLAQGALVSVYTMTNHTRFMPHLPRTTALSLLTLTGAPDPQKGADVVWGIRQLDELDDATRHVALQADDLALGNANTYSWPVFRTAHAADLTRAIYRRVPVRHQQGQPVVDGWGVQTATMLHLTRNAALLRTRQQLEAEGWQRAGEVFRQGPALYVPVYEGTLLRPWGGSPHPDPTVSPRYWVPSECVTQALARVPQALLHAYHTRRTDDIVKVLAAWVGGYHLNRGHTTCTRETLAQAYNPIFHVLPSTPGAWAAAAALEREWPFTPGDLLLIKRQHDALTLARHLIEKHCPEWLMAWRTVIGAGRMVTVQVCPRVGLAQSCALLRLAATDAVLAMCLLANLNSVVIDFCARQKISGRRLTPALLDQLPVVPPSAYAAPCPWNPAVLLRDWVAPRVLELVYTSPALAPLAHNCGYDGPAFPWDAMRRRWLQSEIEAAYCLIYGLARPDVVLLLETCMPGQPSQPSDATSSETLPASELMLQVYDTLCQAQETGTAYRSPFAPPPVALHLGQERLQRIPEKSSEARLQQVEPRPAEHYKTCVPLLDLHAVARAFVEGEEVEPEVWCEVPPGRALRPGMFVMQMVGHAMEPQIPDGAYCLFERQHDARAQALQGRIVLAQHRDIYDPETGGNYTIRRYAQEQRSGRSRSRPTRSIRLLPLHPAYAPMVLNHIPTGERHVIATFLTVLETHA